MPLPTLPRQEKELAARIETAARHILLALMVLKPSTKTSSPCFEIAFESVTVILQTAMSSNTQDAGEAVPAAAGSVSATNPLLQQVQDLLQSNPWTFAGSCFIMRFLYSRLRDRWAFKRFFELHANCDCNSSSHTANRFMGMVVPEHDFMTQLSPLQEQDNDEDSLPSIAMVSERIPNPATAHEHTNEQQRQVRETGSPRSLPLSLSMKTVVRAQNVLLGLFHACVCQLPAGTCTHLKKPSRCVAYRRIYQHVKSCCHDPTSPQGPCPFPFCTKAKRILGHYRDCTEPTCPLCVPVKQQIVLNT